MSEFAFETTAETNEFCQEIVRCLEMYGKKPIGEATRLVNLYWKNEGAFPSDDYRLHEDPYYWAMCIIHDRLIGDNRPDWDRDPVLWPPLKEFLDYWYS